MKCILKLFSIFVLSFGCLLAQNKTSNQVVEKYLPKLEKIFKLHEIVKQIHPTLEHVYPVAIAEDRQFYVFEPTANDTYHLLKQIPISSTIPKGIRAAYPLQENDNKMTCVITGEVFDSMDGYAIIFHEFVHCEQFSTVEMKLKENLEIFQIAMKKQDWMWELNFPLPYSKKEFTETYATLFLAMDKNNMAAVKDVRGTLKQILSKKEYSYMTWVEWKEGFARWVENKVRNKFRIRENHGGRVESFDRTTFYEGGSQLIELAFKSDPQIVQDLEKLYAFIRQ
jgi:hypothetical protein